MIDNSKKPRNIAIIAIVTGIIMPIVINFAYLTGLNCAIFTTMWGAADMLQYFGTLLGAAATIIAVYWTIKSTKDSNRRLIAAKSYLELIEFCSIEKLEYFEEEVLKNKDNGKLLIELSNFEKTLNKIIGDAIALLESQTLNQKLGDFSKWYVGELKKIVNYDDDDQGTRNIYEYCYKVRSEHSKKFNEIRTYAYKLLFS